jgi:hypothetical protein
MEGKMKKIILIIIAILVLPVVNLIAAEDSLRIETVESLGMGGPGTAFYGRYAAMYNPALIGLKKGLHFRLMELPISITNDIFKFYKFYNDNKDDLTDFDNLLKEITKTVTKFKVRLKLGVANPNISAGPFPFPLLGRDADLWWGVGFYNVVDAGAKMNAGILVPTVDFWAQADGVLSIPVTFHTDSLPLRLPGELYAGIGLKYVARSKYEEKRMSILEFEEFDVDSGDLDPGTGYGWDWGLLYGLNDRMRFSLVLRDFLSTRISYPNGDSEVIKGQVDIGGAYQLNKMFRFAGDIRDLKFGDIGKSTLFAKLYLGGEMSLINILKLRGGFYQGYPSFGFGLAGIINYAFYGRELSTFPGQMPEWNHAISFSFGF